MSTSGSLAGSFGWALMFYFASAPLAWASNPCDLDEAGNPDRFPGALIQNPEKHFIGQHPFDALLTDVLGGLDYYVTTSPTHYNFGTSEIPMIPAGFFGPGSDPFLGVIAFTGNPIDPLTSTADTIVQRKANANLPSNGSSDTIPIQLIALSLRSAQPLSLNFSGTQTSMFRVSDGLDTSVFDVVPGPPSQSAVTNSVNLTTNLVLHESFPTASLGTSWHLVTRDGPIPLDGLFRLDSFFDIFADAPLPIPSKRSFDVLLEISPPSGSGTLPMTLPTLNYSPGQPFFDILWGAISDTPNHTQDLQTHVDMNPAQPVALDNVTLVSPNDGQSHVRIEVVLSITGVLSLGSPLMTGHITGSGTSFGQGSFDVFAVLNPIMPAIGTMNITRNDPGGTFTSELQVQPAITFVRQGGGALFFLPGVMPYSITQASAHGWTYLPYPGAPGAGGPDFFPTPFDPLQWTDPSGTPLTVQAAVAPPHAVAWRSVKYHGPQGVNADLGIPLDPAASGNGASHPSVDPRAGSVTRIQVDFDQPVTLSGPVTLTGNVTTGNTMGPMQDFSGLITSVAMPDADTMEITATGLPSQACYSVNVAAAVTNALSLAPAGDTDCSFVLLAGDADFDLAVTPLDLAQIKAVLGTPPSGDPGYDMTLNGTVNLSDAILLFPDLGKHVLCP